MLLLERFLEMMERKRDHAEGTRKDFVPVDRRVVFRIHEEMGPNMF